MPRPEIQCTEDLGTQLTDAAIGPRNEIYQRHDEHEGVSDGERNPQRVLCNPY